MARESEDAFAVKAWDETVIAVLADGAGAARARRGGVRAHRRIAGQQLRRAPASRGARKRRSPNSRG